MQEKLKDKEKQMHLEQLKQAKQQAVGYDMNRLESELNVDL